MCVFVCVCVFFFFNDTATTEIYTLSLHDALPISFNADPNGVPPSTEDCIAGLTLTSFETCEVDAAGVNSCEHYTNVFDERYPPVAGQIGRAHV